MKLYKVEHFVYNRSNSLLPARSPTPEEQPPWDTAQISPLAEAMIQALVNAGYTRIQATHLIYTKFAYYWNVCGIKDMTLCLQTVKWWLQKFLNPVIVHAEGPPPPTIPPVVIYFVVVLSILAVVVLLVAPEWEDEFKWAPPCNLYLGIYKEQLWWMTLAGVSVNQVPFYEAFLYSGSVICAHTYEFIVPPVRTDRFHFWGTMDFACWQIPWFRAFSTQYADCVFIGFLEHVGGNVYKLREPFTDHWAPTGPAVIPEDDKCKILSPCHE